MMFRMKKNKDLYEKNTIPSFFIKNIHLTLYLSLNKRFYNKTGNMGKYLKLFTDHSGYADFLSGGTMIKPNVSHCIEQDDVHYNQYYRPLTVIYNVTDDTNMTQMYYYFKDTRLDEINWVLGANMFEEMTVDGEKVNISAIDFDSGRYHLSEGQHTVTYTLRNNKLIGGVMDTAVYGAMFRNCQTIESVVIPEGVKTIGSNAFYECTGLTSVTIPETVTSIEAGSFFNCDGLVSIVIPDGVTSIGDTDYEGHGAFASCSDLTTVTLPEGLKSIGRYAFMYCTNLSDINIPSSLRNIGNSAFCGCYSLDNETVSIIDDINIYAKSCPLS